MEKCTKGSFTVTALLPVDVSSAVEEQGRKSEEKVRKFLKKVREVQKYE